MKSHRLEAFSDGVLAIIITIMVLEFHVPEGTSFYALLILVPKVISYTLSFIYLGIYWNSHHHIFQIIEKVNGKILWANLNLLFWLSLLPFATAWMGENRFEKHPVALYGAVLFMAAVSFRILEIAAISLEGEGSKIYKALKAGMKEKLSTVGYLIGIVLAFYFPYISLGIFYGIALFWVVPDKRIEKEVEKKSG
ncbi:MAG: TMEM175 family protein [Ginsengibacter sp.]